jgi:mersacidin/lichenicidin family type 2 lantibiotic
MSHRMTIRAWKDEEYRLSLSDAERSQLPENPVGAVELTDSDLSAAVGGIIRPITNAIAVCTSSRLFPCCY